MLNVTTIALEEKANANLITSMHSMGKMRVKIYSRANITSKIGVLRHIELDVFLCCPSPSVFCPLRYFGPITMRSVFFVSS